MEDHTGLEFKIKDFRPSCAQMIKDRNKGPTEIATKQLRHSGPDTTYRSYAQIKSDTANDEVNNLFSQERIASISKSTSCEDVQIG
jgi:integrase